MNLPASLVQNGTKELDDLGKAPYTVEEEKGDPATLQSREELLNHLMAAARKGVHIQRYKGLGEMNAEELWETTMDPEARTLLQVSVEDAARADETFNTLMGDVVAPRKEFITAHARQVQNLDV